MERLRQELQRVVARVPSERALTQRAGLNPNFIADLLARRRQHIFVDSLARLAEACGWPLETAVYWALDREPPARPCPADGEALVRLGCERLRLSPQQTALILEVLQLARAAAPPATRSG